MALIRPVPDAITNFRGKYDFLSNFYCDPDTGYCAEVEYQRLKCANPEQRRMFDGVGPKAAKILGNQVRLKPNWENIKTLYMRDVVYNKFQPFGHTGSPTRLGRLLLDTWPAYIVHENQWDDTYWGTVNGIGLDHLGRILMWVRSEIIPF